MPGNTETTSNDNGGSNAKSQTHQEQQLEITKSDLHYVTSMLNDPHFIAILRSYGYPVDGGRFVFAKEVDRAAIKEQVGIAQQVKLLGAPIDDDYLYELTGIPKPKDYEAQKQAAMQQAGNEPESETKPAKSKKKPQSDDPEDLYDEPTFWYKFRSTLADFFDPPR